MLQSGRVAELLGKTADCVEAKGKKEIEVHHTNASERRSRSESADELTPEEAEDGEEGGGGCGRMAKFNSSSFPFSPSKYWIPNLHQNTRDL
jgi:hypothetical protein